LKRKAQALEFILVFPVAGLLCLVMAFIWAIVRTRLEPASIALGALGIVLYLTKFMIVEASNLKHYLNVSLYSLFTLGTCVVLYLALGPYNRGFDLTTQKLHTLDEATHRYLRLLKEDIEIVVFDVDAEPYRDLLERYGAQTLRVSWKLVDPLRDPVYTRQFDPHVTHGMIYVTHGDNKKLLTLDQFGEGALTNAIVEVTREQRIKIYFLTGHGELDFEAAKPGMSASANPRSLSAFKDYLAAFSMEVESLDIRSKGYIPDDATSIVIAGPTVDLSAQETRWLDDYLIRGGRLLVFFDIPLTSRAEPFTRLVEFLRRHGVDDRRRIILDMQGKRDFGDYVHVPVNPVTGFNPTHPITEELAAAAELMDLTFVRALAALDPRPQGYRVAPLILSSEKSWTEAISKISKAFDNLNAKITLPDPDPEKLKPQPVGWAVQAPVQNGPDLRLVVYGSSRLINNKYISKNDTAAQLMINTIHWLNEREDLIAISKPVIRGSALVLTRRQQQFLLIAIVMAFPALIFFGGDMYASQIRRS